MDEKKLLLEKCEEMQKLFARYKLNKGHESRIKFLIRVLEFNVEINERHYNAVISSIPKYLHGVAFVNSDTNTRVEFIAIQTALTEIRKVVELYAEGNVLMGVNKFGDSSFDWLDNELFKTIDKTVLTDGGTINTRALYKAFLKRIKVHEGDYSHKRFYYTLRLVLNHQGVKFTITGVGENRILRIFKNLY